MKSFTKIISFLLILSLVFSLCACKSADEEESAAAGDVVTGDSEQNESTENNTDNPSDNQENSNTETSENTEKEEDKKPEEKPEENNDQTNKPSPEENNQNTPSPEEENTASEEEYDQYAIEPEFDTYISNTFVPTGNHFALVSVDETTKTFRGVFPVQQTGRLEYAFYFSNCVDSTWGSGDVAYRNMPTESYEILSAAVMVSKSTEASSVSRKTTVTFDGKKSKTVEAEEMFWSDPVMFNVAEGEYLVFEWKVKYTLIPCNKINGVGYGYVSNDNGASFTKASEGMPMPSMIGAKRDGVKSIAFIGDSITAGEGAGVHSGYVAQISKQLGADVSVWNLGLGYARANDAVNSPSWLKKAKATDNVAICLGVNDINSGAYNVGARTADQILGDIKTVAEEVEKAGAKVIIIATPVYSYNGAERVQIWKDVVSGSQKYAKEKGFEFFDFGPVICDPLDSTKPGYGAHPNADGCAKAADAFMQEYKNGNITLK